MLLYLLGSPSEDSHRSTDDSFEIQSNSPSHSVAAGRDESNYTLLVHAFDVGRAPSSDKYRTFVGVDGSVGSLPRSDETLIV